MERFTDKDPSDTDQFAFDFSKRLTTGETLVGGLINASPTGLSIGSSQTTATAIAAWISSGSNGQSYTVTASITTNLGTTIQRSTTLRVINR